MSWEYIDALYKMNPAQWKGASQHSVLVTIGNYADPVTGLTPPLTLSLIANHGGMSRSTAFTALDSKAVKKLAKRETRFKGNIANVFRACWQPTPSERNGRKNTVRPSDGDSPKSGLISKRTVRPSDGDSPKSGLGTGRTVVQGGVNGRAAAAPRTPRMLKMVPTTLDELNARYRR